MRVISVHSIAGGTGVTSVATEIIADKLEADEAVLAIDLGGTQMIGGMNRGRGLETLGDVSVLFSTAPLIPLFGQECLPRRSLLSLQGNRFVYDKCSEDALITPSCSVNDVVDRLQHRLGLLAAHFDVCVVDLSQAPELLKHLFVAVSDEVHFCERLMSEAQTWEAFHETYLKGTDCKPAQLWIKHPDRSEWRPQVIEDSPGLLLADA